MPRAAHGPPDSRPHARIGIDSSRRLGRYRWVVERTGAWFNRDRRLHVRDERRGDIHAACVALAAALILFNDWAAEMRTQAPQRLLD
jgi:hypothetical protein